LSEEAEARYMNGEYVRVTEPLQGKRGRYATEMSTSTSKHDFPTGRLCLQAYCADSRGEWVKQWRETKERELTPRIAEIIKDLMKAAPVIASLIEEGERKAEQERREWDEQRRRWRQQQAEERAAKAQSESKQQLMKVLELWAEAKRIEQFFEEAEMALNVLDPEAQIGLRDRLSRARQLIESADALEQFRRWRAPDELIPAEGFGSSIS